MTIDSEKLVEEYYQGLFRFALSLAKNEADAVDLTQQTFYRWATRGHQLREESKVKSWLFTTLYREFLGTRRKTKKYKPVDMESAEHELPSIQSDTVEKLDAGLAVDALGEVEERYRAPLSLFYLKSHTYQEIADILEIPIGTVMSRLSRGKQMLRKLLSDKITLPQSA